MIRVQSQSTINSARPSVDSNSYLQTNSLSPNSNCLLENKEGSQQYASLLSPSYGYGRESFSLRLSKSYYINDNKLYLKGSHLLRGSLV